MPDPLTAALLEIVESVGRGPTMPTAARRALEGGLERLRRALGVERVLLLALERTSGSLRCVPADGGPEELDARSPAGAAILAGGELAAAGTADTRLSELGLAGSWAVPLRAGGEVLGSLVLTPGDAGPPDARARVVATVAATVLALWQRNAALFAGLRERAQELDRQLLQMRSLTEIARAAGAGVAVGDVAQVVVSEARKLVRADGAALVSSSDGGETSRSLATAGVAPEEGWTELVSWRTTAPRRSAHVAAATTSAGGGRLDALVVVRADPPLSRTERETLDSLGQQAGVALASARLVADLQREQANRRRLAIALIEAQERERARLARDIHDGPIQELVGLGLLLDAVAADLGTGDLDTKALARAAAAARGIVADLRATIVDLHPMALAELGFAGAARSIASRLEDRGVEVELDVAAAAELPAELQAVGVRILQEALTNVMRHAEATRAWITARPVSGGVEVRVRDDGIGFDVSSVLTAGAGGHLGLAGIRERADLAGGRADITSRAGSGTEIVLMLPLEVSGGGDEGPSGG